MKKNVIKIIVVIVFVLIIVFVGKRYLLHDSIDKKWDIHFDNLKASIINGSVFVPVEPEIDVTSVKAYDVLISKRGDFANFTFDVVNAGDIDATLSSFVKLEPKCISLELPAITSDEELVCNNLEYKLFYTKNNQEVKIADKLQAHSSENITLKVGLSKNSDNPQSDVQVTLYDMTLIYK